MKSRLLFSSRTPAGRPPLAPRAGIRELLLDYVGLRIKMVLTESDQEFEQAIQGSEKLQSEIWSRAVEIATAAPTPVSALFVQSLNELIDLHERRITIAVRYRLPGNVWMVLCGLVILAMAMGGFDSGVSSNSRFLGITLAAAVAFSAVIVMVVALDRPHQHLSTATQAPMLDLQEDIRRSMESQP